MKQKYVSVKPLLKYDFQYALMIGERSNGKSYSVKEHVLKNYKKTGGKFVYLRRYQIEVKPSYIDGYFRDAPVSQIFDDYETITSYRGGIYLTHYDEELGRDVRGDLIGYSGFLSNESHYKSQNYNDVTDIIFEEFITADGYLYDEVNKLLSYVSTVARRRKIRVWLIGNTISRLCPYYSEFGLSFVRDMKQGEIRLCEHETDQIDENGEPVKVKIAVYFCENASRNSKMFFGTISDMITKGTWQTRNYPHLPYRYRECESVYQMQYKYKEFLFKFEILKTPRRDYVIFIHPHKEIEDLRTITDVIDTRAYFTRDFRIITQGDKLFDLLWNDGKVFYSDNLTGSDLESIIADKGVL